MSESNHVDGTIAALIKLRDACTTQGIQIVDVQGVGPSSHSFPNARRGVSMLVRVDVPVGMKETATDKYEQSVTP